MHRFDPTALRLTVAPDLERELPDEEATRALGRALADALVPGDMLGLIGQLGAGKTTLMKGLMGRLSPDVPVSSPTYTLMQHYPGAPAVVHVDLYRLEDVDDLESMGYWDVVEEPQSIVCVEWLDRVLEAWSPPGLVCELLHTEEGTRRARIWASDGPRRERVVLRAQGAREA